MTGPIGSLGGRPSGVPEELAARSPQMPSRSRRASGIVNTATPGFRKILPQFETADRPSPGIMGRAIWDVDEEVLYIDNGTAWIPINGTGAVSFESNVWNANTSVTMSDSACIYWKLSIGPLSISVTAPQPRFGGQMVLACVNAYSGVGTYTIDGLAGGTVFQHGGTEYNNVVFNSLSDAVLLQGYHKNDVLQWHVVTNNGALLT